VLCQEFSKDLKVYRGKAGPRVPRVSIILPTYARASGHLQRALESVLEQSYSDFELLVVDDGSRDETQDVLADYLKRDDRIAVLRFEMNSGLPALRVNQAILMARGEFIAYQFDDDIWTSGSLAARMDVAADLGASAVVYGNAEVELLGTDGSIARGILGGPFSYGQLSASNYIANNSVLHHRAVFDRVGLYDPHVLARRYSDYDLWLRMSREFEFHWVDETVSRVRANEEGSLGRTISLNYLLSRQYLEVKRNALLLPEAISSYDVTGTQHLRGYSGRELDHIRRSEIIPFIARHSDYCPPDELAVAGQSRRSQRRLLVVKPHLSTAAEARIGPLAQLPNCQFRHCYVQEAELRGADVEECETIILAGTQSHAATCLLETRQSEKTFVYLLGDASAGVGKSGLAPVVPALGSLAFTEISEQVSRSHACIRFGDSVPAGTLPHVSCPIGLEAGPVLQADDFLCVLDAADLHRHLGPRRILFALQESLDEAALNFLQQVKLARSIGFDVIGLVGSGADIELYKQRWNTASGGAELVVIGRPAGQLAGLPIDEETRSLMDRLSQHEVGLIHAAASMPAMSRLAGLLNVPCVFSLDQYGMSSATGAPDAILCSLVGDASKWSKVTGSPARRLMPPVDQEYFGLFARNVEREWHPNAIREVVVAGPRVERRGQIETIAARAAQNVAVASLSPDDVTLDCLKGADILVVDLDGRSPPLAVFQAMASGVIVVATGGDRVSELIRHRYSGFIVTDLSETSLSQAISEALHMNTAQRADLLSRANRTISVLARPSYVRAELMDTYNQAFERKTLRPTAGDCAAGVPRSAPFQPHALRSAIDAVAELMQLAERLLDAQVDIVAAKGNELLREVSRDCECWRASETADKIDGLTLFLTNRGQQCNVTIAVSAAKRPDLPLRTMQFRLPATSTPMKVAVSFEPLVSRPAQEFRLDVASMGAAIDVHLHRQQQTVFACWTGQREFADRVRP
jgi:glycosyltransferase involved in cell wall biosynthesis